MRRILVVDDDLHTRLAGAAMRRSLLSSTLRRRRKPPVPATKPEKTRQPR
jgi:hypothetical protein